MKEYTKKQLLKIIVESKLTEDMAYVPGTERTKSKPSKAVPQWIAEPDPNDNRADAWILNPYQEKGKEIALVYTHGQEVDKWLSDPTNKQWLDTVIAPKVHQKGENLKIVDWKKTKYFNPKSPDIKKLKSIGIDWPETKGDKIPERELILRNMLYPYLTKFTEEVNQHLISTGVPPITMPKQLYGGQTENIDKYMEISSDKIKWRTYTSYYFNSYDEFKQYMGGNTDIEPVQSHQPRRYNPGSNWSPLRKIEKKPSYIDNEKSKYNINKSGYSNKPYGVVVGSELIVEGVRTKKDEGGDEFDWKLTFVIESGKKLDGEVQTIETDLTLVSTSSTGMVDDITNGNGTISNSPLVRMSLSKALTELESKINSNVRPEVFSDLQTQQSN